MPDDGGKPGGSDKPPGLYRTFPTPIESATRVMNLQKLLEAQLKEGYYLHSLTDWFVVVYKEVKGENHLI